MSDTEQRGNSAELTSRTPATPKPAKRSVSNQFFFLWGFAPLQKMWAGFTQALSDISFLLKRRVIRVQLFFLYLFPFSRPSGKNDPITAQDAYERWEQEEFNGRLTRAADRLVKNLSGKVAGSGWKGWRKALPFLFARHKELRPTEVVSALVDLGLVDFSGSDKDAAGEGKKDGAVGSDPIAVALQKAIEKHVGTDPAAIRNFRLQLTALLLSFRHAQSDYKTTVLRMEETINSHKNLASSSIEQADQSVLQQKRRALAGLKQRFNDLKRNFWGGQINSLRAYPDPENPSKQVPLVWDTWAALQKGSKRLFAAWESMAADASAKERKKTLKPGELTEQEKQSLYDTENRIFKAMPAVGSPLSRAFWKLGQFLGAGFALGCAATAAFAVYSFLVAAGLPLAAVIPILLPVVWATALSNARLGGSAAPQLIRETFSKGKGSPFSRSKSGENYSTKKRWTIRIAAFFVFLTAGAFAVLSFTSALSDLAILSAIPAIGAALPYVLGAWMAAGSLIALFMVLASSFAGDQVWLTVLKNYGSPVPVTAWKRIWGRNLDEVDPDPYAKSLDDLKFSKGFVYVCAWLQIRAQQLLHSIIQPFALVIVLGGVGFTMYTVFRGFIGLMGNTLVAHIVGGVFAGGGFLAQMPLFLQQGLKEGPRLMAQIIVGLIFLPLTLPRMAVEFLQARKAHAKAATAQAGAGTAENQESLTTKLTFGEWLQMKLTIGSRNLNALNNGGISGAGILNATDGPMAQLQGPIKIMLMAISVIFGSLLSAAVVAKADVHIPTRTEAEKLYEGEIDRSWADDIAPQASAEDSPLAETAVDGADALTQSEGSAPEAVPEKAASVRTGGWTAGLFSAKAAEVSKLSSQEDARRAIVGLEGRMTAGAA